MTHETLFKAVMHFLLFQDERVFLSVLAYLILFFVLITFVFFMATVFLRIKNRLLSIQDVRFSKNWDEIILKIMHEDLHPFDGYKKLKRKNSIRYLFYLEQYIDLLKGKEKERLLALGRLSLKRIYRLLRSHDRGKKIYGIHLMGIFHPEEQYRFLIMKPGDMNLTLTAIREMHAANDVHIKEQLIRMLFGFPSISYIYISNLLVEMGPDIVPFLRQTIEKRFEAPHEQMIAIETVRRMHVTDCLDLGEEVLTRSTDPGVLSCWCRYAEDHKDITQFSLILPLLDHPNQQVRTAATRTYLVLSETVDADDIQRIFNDSSIMVAINAAEILEHSQMLPYIATDAIERMKWKDIYREIMI